MVSKNEFRLIKEVMARSHFTNWDDAIKEWKQTGIIQRDYDDPGQCICGKYPILEEIQLQNHFTKIKIIVGNCCVKKFFGVTDFGKVFKALSQNKVNAFMIDDSHEKGLLSNWERQFMMNTWRIRVYRSRKQQELFFKIRDKIIQGYQND